MNLLEYLKNATRTCEHDAQKFYREAKYWKEFHW